MPLINAITVGGVARTDDYSPGSLSISEDLGARSTCRFVLNDPTNAISVALGASIDIRDETNAILFAGTVERVGHSWPTKDINSPHHRLVVSCVDYNQLADRRLIAVAILAGLAPGEIVKEEILTPYLADEGVTEGNIELGLFEMGDVRFSYEPCSDALDKIAQAVGFIWWIDYEKKLNFIPRDSAAAVSIGYTDSSLPVMSLEVETARDAYRNRQYLRAGKDVIDTEIVESFRGDGDRRTFSVALEIAEAPTVTIDTGGGPTAQTVGIREIDAGVNWYYQRGSKEISQDADDTVLGSSDIVAITYRGLIPILVQADDDAEIADRVSVEGGSGLYEQLETDTSIEDSDLAVQQASGFLSRFGRLPLRARIQTDGASFRVGTIQDIELTREGLSGSFLIQSVDAQDRGDCNLVYSYDCTEGDRTILWSDYYKRLAEQGAEFSISENEIIILIRTAKHTIGLDHDASSTASGSSLGSWTSDPYTVGVVGSSMVGGHWDLTDGTRIAMGPLVGSVSNP